jgi:hypothetical protein
MSIIKRLGALWSDPQTRPNIVNVVATALATALLGLLGWGALHILDALKTHDMALSVRDPIVTGTASK